MSIILMFVACFSGAGIVPVNEDTVVICGEAITVNYNEDPVVMEDNFFQAIVEMEKHCSK